MYAVLIKCSRKLTTIPLHFFPPSLSFLFFFFTFHVFLFTFDCIRFVLFLWSQDYTSIIVLFICICMRWQLSTMFWKKKKNCSAVLEAPTSTRTSIYTHFKFSLLLYYNYMTLVSPVTCIGGQSDDLDRDLSWSRLLSNLGQTIAYGICSFASVF